MGAGTTLIPISTAQELTQELTQVGTRVLQMCVIFLLSLSDPLNLEFAFCMLAVQKTVDNAPSLE